MIRLILYSVAMVTAIPLLAQQPLDSSSTKAQWKFGGYVKLDYIHDLNPVGNVNFFDVSTIPIPQATGTNVHMQANETRLFTSYANTYNGMLYKVYAEGDFYGANGTFRLRHAFIEAGQKHRILAGQYWSNFMDEDIIPQTLDFEKPIAYAFLRHAMIRYSYHTGNHTIAVAIEEPSQKIQTPVAVSGKLESYAPDLTFRYRYQHEKWHMQASAFAASTRFNPDSGTSQTVNMFGINLSAKWNFYKQDYIAAQVIYGPGITRYRGGKAAAPESDGTISGIEGIGYFIGLRHFWHKKWSSMAVGNYGFENATALQTATDTKAVWYSALNICWHFIPNGFVGIEYLYGVRENVSGQSAYAQRVQASFKMNFGN